MFGPHPLGSASYDTWHAICFVVKLKCSKKIYTWLDMATSLGFELEVTPKPSMCFLELALAKWFTWPTAKSMF